MKFKNQYFSNFSRALHTISPCFRPDNEWELADIFKEETQPYLARGQGLSYSDCCVFNAGRIIDTRRLNHLLSFEPTSGLAVCQGAATFSDLFLLDADFIPPVLPGTLFATVAGGIAHDVHGKNNYIWGNLGHHIVWLELQIGTHTLYCDPHQNQELFFATIAGLGLTGVIKRVGLQLRKASRSIKQTYQHYTHLTSLLADMQSKGLHQDYQAAWLDLLNEPRGILYSGNHIAPQENEQEYRIQSYALPRIPLPLINHWLMKQFNRCYYYTLYSKTSVLPVWQFNNPLDSIKNWNYLYGKKGLLQFQAVFNTSNALSTLNQLYELIHHHQATPTLAVLKLLTQPGLGILSFVKPGFTLAIDFINNSAAHQTIKAMNQLITDIGGRIYLAKDLFLTPEQFRFMYPAQEQFKSLQSYYKLSLQSDLSKRLGLA